METVAISVLCAVLAGLVLFMIQKSEKRYDRLEEHLEKKFCEMNKSIGQCLTEIAVLKDRAERHES